MNTSEIIKKVRTENNLTKHRMAEIMGVQAQTVSAWERGKYEPPFSTVTRVLELLNYHIEIVDDYREDRSKRTLDGIKFDIWNVKGE